MRAHILSLSEEIVRCSVIKYCAIQSVYIGFSIESNACLVHIVALK